MLESFERFEVMRDGVRLSGRRGGRGAPLLLLHGHPQTSVMWHRVAPALAERFSLVLLDLRGYGDSDRPPAGADGGAYSKREMALDAQAVMQAHGHARYGVLAHVRGARVAHRLAADHPQAVQRLLLLDIAPTALHLLGIDPHAYAENIARQKFARGETVLEIAENRRLLGQYPPEAEADLSLAHDPLEEQVLGWIHHIYNKRMFGKIRDIYASNCQWHGPLMRELYGPAAVLQQTMRLVALVPDCAMVPQHICSNPSEEGGVKVAVRWMMDGHHFGYGALGAPTGHKLSIMGITHFHIIDGKIVDEWVVYDELSMLVQLKLAEMQKNA